MDLNPQQFFHGTRANIPVGGHILPSKITGVEPAHEISMPNRVYSVGTQPHDSSPHRAEESAWRWSTTGYHGDGPVLDRPWVARVKPKGAVSDEDIETTSKSAKVLERIDIKPGHQGTFPSLNWNQFGHEYGDYNHPSDEDIQGGHDVYARKYRPGFWDPPEKDLDSPEHRFEYDKHDPDPGQGKLF